MRSILWCSGRISDFEPFIWHQGERLNRPFKQRPYKAQGNFDRALNSWRDSRFVSTVRDDWQFFPWWGLPVGPRVWYFEIDATSDETGSTAHFAKFWHAKDDCRSHDWAGLNVFCNLPFSIMLSIILHFIKSKLRSPLGTSATFVVPAWLEHDALRLIIEMPAWFRRIRTFPTGSDISPRKARLRSVRAVETAGQLSGRFG